MSVGISRRGFAGSATELAEGEYLGSATGIGGELTVKVTMDGDALVAVGVVEDNETPGIGSVAIEQLPAKIVEAGGTEGVDAVAGATTTSHAIIAAVEDALSQR